MLRNKGLADKLRLTAGLTAGLGAIAMPVLNPDLFWHLSAGRFMVENLRLPAADFLSWTEYGARWTDFEWLSQLLFYGAHSLAGKTGLFLLKTLVLGASFPVFYRLLALYSAESFAFFALPLWGLAIFPNADIRPENFSVLFFALLLWRLEKARISASPWPRGPRAWGALAALFALWANLHAGFVYGAILLLFYSAGGWLDAKLGGRDPGAAALPPAGAALLGAAAALLNPWGPKIYSVLLDHAAEATLVSRYLAEWAPARLSNPWHWPFMFFLLLSFSLLLRRFLREKRVPAAHLLALAFFGFSASGHARHIVFFSMAACAFSSEMLRLEADRLPAAGRALFAAALAYLLLAVWPLYRAFAVSPGEEAAGAAACLKKRTAEFGGRKLYNPWTWGGYLGWTLAPDYRVFVDGRYLFHKYLAPLSAAMEDQHTWDRFAEERGFELVLFRRDGAALPYEYSRGGTRTAISRPAWLVFMPEKKWALVHWDGAALLFARRGLAREEFRLVRPGDLEFLKLELCSGKASAALARRELASHLAAAGPGREMNDFGDWLKTFPASCHGLAATP